jgi:hypothetical protein
MATKKNRKVKSKTRKSRSRKGGALPTTPTTIPSTTTPPPIPTKNNKKLEEIIQLLGQNMPRLIGQSIEGIEVGDKLTKFMELYTNLRNSINQPTLETYNKVTAPTLILGMSDYTEEIGKRLDEQLKFFSEAARNNSYDALAKKIVLYNPSSSQYLVENPTPSKTFPWPSSFRISTNT